MIRIKERERVKKGKRADLRIHDGCVSEQRRKERLGKKAG